MVGHGLYLMKGSKQILFTVYISEKGMVIEADCYVPFLNPIIITLSVDSRFHRCIKSSLTQVHFLCYVYLYLNSSVFRYFQVDIFLICIHLGSPVSL